MTMQLTKAKSARNFKQFFPECHGNIHEIVWDASRAVLHGISGQLESSALVPSISPQGEDGEVPLRH